MNKIILKGTINNIQPSHTIGDIEYSKATLAVKRSETKEDIINLKFKKFSNCYQDGQEIELQGNVRTFSQKLADKNRVEVYVFTYFDLPENSSINTCEIDGRICKLNPIRKTKTGKDVIDFILANNLISDNQSLNCYIPCVAWGKLAKKISLCGVGDYIRIIGQLQSREYQKKLDNNDFEIRVAHELNISEILED